MNAPAADDGLGGFKTELPLAPDIHVCIKRIYEKPVRRDGYRVLVDRLWPRGIKKESAALDEWLRDIAPTTELQNGSRTNRDAGRRSVSDTFWSLAHMHRCWTRFASAPTGSA